MQAGQSDWKYITKYTFADGETGGIWYDSSGNFIGDNLTTLRPADDAATQQLGSPWRMPTVDEQEELITKCTWTWTTQDGVNGYQVDGPNGNAIFLPAAGYRSGSALGSAGSRGFYLSNSHSSHSSYSTSRNDVVFRIYFYSNGQHSMDTFLRYLGFSVRPVRP